MDSEDEDRLRWDGAVWALQMWAVNNHGKTRHWQRYVHEQAF